MRTTRVLICACLAVFLALAAASGSGSSEGSSGSSSESNQLSFEYIVVGGGGAGATLAGKLARAGKSVLVLEAGANTQYDPSIAQSMGFYGSFNTQSGNTGISSDTTFIYPNTVVGDSGRYGQKSPPGAGKGIGGSTSINLMNCVFGGKWMYDFDKWPATWNYESMRPFYAEFKAAIQPNRETKKPVCTQHWLKALREQADAQYAAGGMDYLVNMETYGQGPNVENPDPAAPQLDHNDLNGTNSVVAFSQFQFFINKLANGTYVRKAAANTYLGPDCLKLDGTGTVQCPRLRALTGANVDKILFDSTRSCPATAVGVRFWHDGVVKTATASREVIVSAGAYQTPAILQRSGVGPSAYLNSLGIPVVYNNTQVGRNLINHFSSLMGVKVVGDQSAINEVMADAAVMGGNMGFNGGAMLTYHKNHPNKPLRAVSVRKTQFMLYSSGAILPGHVSALYGITRANETLTFAIDDMRFEGSGYVQIASKSPFDFPEVYFNTFVPFGNPKGLTGQAFWEAARLASDPIISALLEYNIGYRTAVGMNATLAASGSGARVQIAFPTFSYLAALEDGIQTYGNDWWKYLFPANVLVPCSTQHEKDFVNALNSLVIEIRALGAYVDSHQCGTAKIGAVVDESLNVIGVNGLRVVDASIMPGQSGGNTGATAMVIGLRGFAEVMRDASRK